MIMDMTLQRFVADRIFASGGGVTGGAVVFDSVEANDLYTDRDVERVSPGAEFPIVTSARRAPGVAEVEKWGGKVWISDEARDRNDATLFTNQIRQLSNTIVRKINARAIQVLEAMFTAYPSRVVVSKSQGAGGWDAVTPYGATPTAPGAWPAADFAFAAGDQRNRRDGDQLRPLDPQPVNYTDLLLLYGGDGIQELLSHAEPGHLRHNRVPLNTAYVVAQGQVGQMRSSSRSGPRPGVSRTAAHLGPVVGASAHVLRQPLRRPQVHEPEGLIERGHRAGPEARPGRVPPTGLPDEVTNPLGEEVDGIKTAYGPNHPMLDVRRYPDLDPESQEYADMARTSGSVSSSLRPAAVHRADQVRCRADVVTDDDTGTEVEQEEELTPTSRRIRR
jgi:hypothetical protein